MQRDSSEIRYRHVRAAYAATIVDGGYRDFPDPRIRGRNRTAYCYYYDGGLTRFGPGGYDNLYYPVSFDRDRGYGDIFDGPLCADCATAYLRQDSANAVYPHCTINGGYDERHGEYCGDCGECIIEPSYDAVVIFTDDDDFDGSILYLTITDWDTRAAAYGLFVIRAMLPRYPNLRIERFDWMGLTDLTARFGEGSVNTAISYLNY